MPAFLKIMSMNAFFGAFLSIIPGLAHYVEGRFREVRWFVLGWFLLLLGGIFFYGGNIGFLLLGLAVGVHGWIAFSHSLLASETEFNKRIIDYALLLITLSLIYWGIRVLAFGDFVFSISTLTIPAENVRVEDTLLARYSRAHGGVLPRGSLVLGAFHRYGNYIPNLIPENTYETMGQVIALPGEKMEIIEGRFVVDGEALDADGFPVPVWLSGSRLSATIPAGSYFISTVYQVNAHGIQLTGDMIRDVCILKAGDIRARVVMRWFPLAKRGFLRAGE
jgi:hypothetical protein